MNLDPSALTLNTLKEAARTEHLAIVNADLDSLGRAMTAGDVLREIIDRKLVGHGQRKALFEETCDSVRTAQVYIQLSQARALIEVEANAQRAAHLSIREALRLLQQHNGTRRSSKKKTKPIFTLAAWLALPPTERTKLLDDIGVDGFRQAMSLNFYRQLRDLVRVEKVESTPSGKGSMLLKKGLSHIKSADKADASEAERLSNFNEAVNCLRALLKIAEGDPHRVSIGFDTAKKKAAA